MSDKYESGVETLDERKFIKLLAGQSLSEQIENRNEILGLTNLHQESYLIKNQIHPLAYSPDYKNHPNMIAIPTCYKFGFNIPQKYEELKKFE